MSPFSTDNCRSEVLPMLATQPELEFNELKFLKGPIIVGGGPSGLATAACLKKRGIASMIFEKSDCIASLWKYRTYDRIQLHLPKHFCELPLLPISQDYPDALTPARYIQYLEGYARHFDLCPRFNENVLSASYDDSSELWTVCTVNHQRGNFGIVERYASRWLVVASGENAVPFLPSIEGIHTFKRTILHSCSYKNGGAFLGRSVLVVGCGNSGMEIALDLYHFGALPTIVVRGCVHVLPIRMFGMHTFTVITKLLKLFPVWLADKLLVLSAWWKLRSTSKYGLKRPKEGPLSMKNRLGKTPVLDVGTYPLIKKGIIKVRPAVERFTEKGALFIDGTTEEFDAIVFATGYKTNVLDWLVSENKFFSPEGLPKSRNVECWKGKNGLYTVGLSGKGNPGTWAESQQIAEDIEASPLCSAPSEVPYKSKFDMNSPVCATS